MITQTLVTILSAAWLIMFITGRSQYERIKKRTIELLLKGADLAKKRNLELSVEQYYDQLQPAWEQMVRDSAHFILHKTELWPVLATPEYVRKRMNFTPAWLGAYLRLHGHKLSAAPELEEQIKAILDLAPKQTSRKQCR